MTGATAASSTDVSAKMASTARSTTRKPRLGQRARAARVYASEHTMAVTSKSRGNLIRLRSANTRLCTAPMLNP